MVKGKNSLTGVIRAGLYVSVCVAPFISVPALADQTIDIGTIQATTTGNVSLKNGQSATYQAPATTPLQAVQPTSAINLHYIQNNVIASSNYDDVIKNTPSVSSVGPDGPGLMENMGLSIRGFQDGEYNITFDGLVWGDSNDFTHHSTSYFMAHDIGGASVDRGPGTASTVGTATFGGTVAVVSKAPLNTMTFEPYGMIGSYSTDLYGGEFDTGQIASMNGASGFIDVEHLTSNGRLTYSGQRRTNAFAKFEWPISSNTVVTFAAMYNKVHQYVPLGATKAEIATLGYNYGLNDNPASQAYYGYNYDRIRTDFEYVSIRSAFGDGWSLDNTFYTYAYFHHGWNGLDPNGETPNVTSPDGTTILSNTVPGERMKMDYRSFGIRTRGAKDLPFGTVKFGLWFDHQVNSRFQEEINAATSTPNYIDPTTGSPDPNLGPNFDSVPAINRDMHDSMDSFQPYIEFDWKPLPGLTLMPGVKYAYFHRHLNAKVNQKTGLSLNYGKTYNSVLPSFEARYMVKPHWSTYAQVAKGFLAPNLNVFYTQDPSKSSVNPQTSWNYQIGTSYQTNRLSFSGDLYYIDFGNMIGKRKIANNTIFFNLGGVIYKGVELEATYYIGDGFSVFANGSINDAKDKTDHQWIANAPKNTAAFGVIFNHNSLYGSLITKYVGSRYGDSGQTEPLGGYATTDLALSYDLKNVTRGIPEFKIKVQVGNLFDRHGINGLAGYTGMDGIPLYWTIPGRNFFISLSAPF